MLVNKPYGITSFNVISKLRKILNIKKMGHTGTLDPIATGVLPVFFGSATKAISFLNNTNKEYVAGFKFGIKTDTKDLTGKVLVEEKTNVEEKDLLEVLKKFIGEIEQVPPMFSAVKVKGVALYKLARKGQTVERNKRTVKIYSLELMEFNKKEQTAKIKVLCSSGTYIRSLIEDVAKRLNTVAVMTSLKRTMACGFFLKECFSLNEIETLKEKEELNLVVISIEKIFSNLKKVEISKKQKLMLLNGEKVKTAEKFKENEMLRVYEEEFLGVAFFKEGFLIVKKIFNRV